MNALIAIALCVAAPPTDVSQAESATGEAALVAPVQLRTRDQWLDEVSEALRGQALAEPVDQPSAYVRLISLYQDLLRDETLNRHDKNRLKLKLRHRLLRLFAEYDRDLASRQNKIEVVRRRAEVEDRPEKLKLIEEDETVLAQWDAMLGQVLGGQQPGAAGGGGPRDYGEDLVELIQRVIAPDFWDVNGGPGTIVYYQNLRVLVVSATSEVHEQLGGGRGILDGLRRAGN